jgi:16S rRNA A1518/A1519 N6-dimethyltransferase RsmA/KsgA/DIM1 with predicted DNA glycosylase/AP lyase activity
VHSSVLRIDFHAPSPLPRDPKLFAGLTRNIFTRRRKMLVNALGAFSAPSRLTPEQALARAHLDGRRRPETLTVEELVRLADIYAEDH